MLNENVEILEHDGDRNVDTPTLTIPNFLLNSAEKHPRPDAFRFKEAGEWKAISTDRFLVRVAQLTFALRALGVRPGDRVAIMSENRLEWAISDYAILCAGGVTVPIYPTLSEPQVEHLLEDSAPVAVFVSDRTLAEKVESARCGLDVRYTIAFDRDVDQPEILPLDRLYDIGQNAIDSPAEFEALVLAVRPDNLATIIYTSGTTGIPKGAMLTHRNLASNVLATLERLPLSENDVELSFLPLSHVFQRHVDYASFFAGSSIAYAAGSTAVADNIAEVQATFVAGVPRFFEKVHSRILSEVSHGPAVRRLIFDKALHAGLEYVRTGHSTLTYRAAERAVFRRIRQRLGGHMRFFIAGGAPLDKEIAEFFFAIGLPVFEGYGLTETSPVLTLNGPGAFSIGTVGRPVGDVELQMADDGEILARGSSVMQGYHNMPAETEEALRGGWFHTGDIGRIDANGFLTITDRKKDLIVTSSGKNIAPQLIENRLKRIAFFDQVMVVGDGRNYVSALIVPNLEALSRYAQAHAIPFDNPSELLDRPEIHEAAMGEIESRTEDLAPFEKVRKIVFLEKPFTIDGGELTPTMKVRRSEIANKYKAYIDQLYAPAISSQ